MRDTRTLDDYRDKWAPLICPEADVYHVWKDVFTVEGNKAECLPHPELNTICIRVTPVDVKMPTPEEFGIERDIEAEYVHELLHYMFANIEPKGRLAYNEWESVIERIAQLIIKLDRKNEELY